MRYTVNFIPGFDTTPNDSPDVEISVSSYNDFVMYLLKVLIFQEILTPPLIALIGWTIHRNSLKNYPTYRKLFCPKIIIFSILQLLSLLCLSSSQ